MSNMLLSSKVLEIQHNDDDRKIQVCLNEQTIVIIILFPEYNL